MINQENKKDTSKGIHHYWVLFLSSKDEIFKVQRYIDNIFSNYSFYPANDWTQYGYRPPERYQVLGAWRHPNSIAFAFLLDNPNMMSIDPTVQVVLYVSGDSSEISILESKVENLKSQFKLKDQKTELAKKVRKRLNSFNATKSFKKLSGILGIFTIIVNAFSLYLRKLPPPNFGNKIITDVYNYSVAIIHFLALLFLFIIIVIFIIFFLKYAKLIIKRL
ncbi:MAG: hypothetical protein KAW92_14885 [Candidatus Cloacimonetes bacterium]|nr:hypothetical protein [Candidatus Cloacimonadota bacterium]